MAAVSATEFAREFGRYKEEAQREPVAITTYGRVSGYFVSTHEYAELQRLRAMERRAYRLGQLPRDLIEAIVTARMDPKHDDLNRLLTETP
ncbi:MAG: type II toxin-antitoxin system Phd/YefM family antitoxin [Steroidobacteraceae bacterium]